MKTIEEQIKEVEDRRTELFAAKKSIDEELSKLYGKLKKLKDKKTEQDLQKEMPFGEKFSMLTKADGSGRQYDAMEEMLSDLGLYVHGYFPFSGQYQIKFHVKKDDTEHNQKVLNGLEKVLPFVLPMNQEGDKRFVLFESSLSAHGIYNLVYSKEGVWKLLLIRYGREQILKEWKDLKECLDYLAKHHYYGDDDDDEESY